MAGAPKSLFGEIAVKMRLLTREQLAQCVVAQLRSEEPRRIGDVCEELGYLTNVQVERILTFQRQIVERSKGAGGAAKVAKGSGQEASRAKKERAGGRAPGKGQARDRPAGRGGSRGATPELAVAETGAARVERNASPPQPLMGTLEVDIDWSALARGNGGKAALPDPVAGGLDFELPPVGDSPAELQDDSAGQKQELNVDLGKAETAVEAEPPAASPPELEAPPARAARATAAPSQKLKRGDTGPIDALLRGMVEVGASDLHLVTGMPPLVRLHGKMRPLVEQKPFEHAELQEMLFAIITDRAYTQFVGSNDADFGYAIEGLARFRANYFFDRRGIGAVFRFIPFEILTPDQIGLPEKVLDLCGLSKGLVLVTGPTGSGKSTTLATLVDLINRSRDEHIITIEDPVEFVHENKKCLVNQREIGTHTESFKSALRAALREDPDIVLVGEMRDLETISIAIETAETGHLVFGTLHTTTAPSTVDRIIDQFPADQQAQIRTMLSGSLRGVISQVLCSKKGGGRVAAYEVLMGTPAVANLIREGKTQQVFNVMQTGRHLGMQTMNDHLTELVNKGKVTANEAYFRAYDKSALLQSFKSAGVTINL